MSNRLAHETSPYLLQHANNPVDWFPWGNEALDKAVNEDKPIFLSIGYSACHWCHVMEHESFEDTTIAAFLNEHFVSIKVDREERPDLDQIYMQAVMALRGGHGGWPLSAFLTPKHHVFYGGTYWPPRSRMNMPGFLDVLQRVAEAFRIERTKIEEQSQQVTAWLNESTNTSRGILDSNLLANAVDGMRREFDFAYGGFGTAPKFPHASTLRFLLRAAVTTAAGEGDVEDNETIRQMVSLNLDGMRRGGIYDQIGGGFARYSVDREWLVPHFEKMLYDNALLASTYLEASQALGVPDYARIAQETLEFMLAELHDPLGGFQSSLDADSEGVEGKFYVWDRDELLDVLGKDEGELMAEYFGVTHHGNFEEKNILFLPASRKQFAKSKNVALDELDRQVNKAKRLLMERRNTRIRPHKDNKVISSWNSLAISAFADGGRVLQESRYVDAARNALDFSLRYLTDGSGRLLRSYRNGIGKTAGFLDDYAYLIVALLDVYAATFDESLLEKAVTMSEEMLRLYSDRDAALFFYVGSDQQQLISRSKDQQDSSIPSGNSMAAEGLLRLSRLTGRIDFEEKSLAILAETAALIRRAPLAASQALVAAKLALEPREELVIVTDSLEDNETIRSALAEVWLPTTAVLMRCKKTDLPHCKLLEAAFQGRESFTDLPALFFCENGRCERPIAGIGAVLESISKMGRKNR